MPANSPEPGMDGVRDKFIHAVWPEFAHDLKYDGLNATAQETIDQIMQIHEQDKAAEKAALLDTFLEAVGEDDNYNSPPVGIDQSTVLERNEFKQKLREAIGGMR